MRNKNFIIIVIGQIISLFGNAIQRFSMSLYVLEVTGSTGAFSTILAISTIPYIIFAPIAGALADNINKKKIMVYLDLISAFLIGGYAFIVFSGNDNEVIITIVMFILSITYTLYGPAVTSSIPRIVDESKLTSANGIINQVGSVVNFLGPILAGILYGLFGIRLIIVINAFSFLISAIMEMFLDIPDVVREGRDSNLDIKKLIKDSIKDMKVSLSYLNKEKKIVLGIIASYALCNIFLVPILSIITPFFINVYLELPSQIYGFVEGLAVLGMIVGGIWITIKPDLFTMKKLHYTYFPMIAGITLMAITTMVNYNKQALAMIYGVGGLLIMLSLALSNVLTLTYTQKQIPEGMLGRVSAFSVAVSTVSIAPGQILFGQAIEIGISLSSILFVSMIASIFLVVFIKRNIAKI